ncbi:MAG TPA: prepilin-type N-terminal cleavage/methylation domain-containing protein [Gemmata sp.]
MSRTARPRPAFTLIELLAVLAVIIIMAAVLVPSLSAFRGDSHQRAGADVVRAELAHARARARDEGRPYRVAVSEDGARIRREPDGPEFGAATAASVPGGEAVVEYPFDHATVRVEVAEGAPPAGEGGWVTVALVLPDGTCREDQVFLAIRDTSKPGAGADSDRDVVYVRVRGLTGSSRVVANPFTDRSQ